MTDTIARVNRIIADHLTGKSPDKLTPETKFLEDLGADSLDMVELTMAFEEEFGIEISDDEGSAVSTVGECHKLASDKLGAK